MKRRDFLQMTTAAVAGAGLGAQPVITARPPTAPKSQSGRWGGRSGSPRLDLSQAPNFASHEHWSLTTIRSAQLERKRGVTPPGPADIRNFIPHGNRTPSVEECRKMWSGQRRRYGLSGNFECIRRGIHALHGADLAQDDPEVWAAASASITRAYEDLNGWTPRAMKQTHQSHLLRTVAPQYYTLVESAREAAREKTFTNTLLRLDPILTMFPKKGGTDDDAFITQTPTWWKSRHVPIMPKEWRDE